MIWTMPSRHVDDAGETGETGDQPLVPGCRVDKGEVNIVY